ncbi:MAG: hypothetical protein ACD_3C00193G0008 [uncultured bacterium (gcode 4)]|uniref:Fibrobacter succinogenes major paralogous domain-containing protein n=1 Tax=uncultured bacterium (gcode 4) TaxID=1234023 RepID=K2GW43_9BACT|nr:MAG: hypothetical protein ACD_3C00193G0008 [uncultured bacterium (gcode 4)]
MSIKKNKAFTLVELIVVIVILAILATIAFLSFSSQSATARDSTRLADISNIAKGLIIFNATTGKYPNPDNYVTITASWTTIWFQWSAGISVLNIAKLSNWWKDPLDTSAFYTYSINSSQSKFQLLWFLEDWSSSALSLNPDFAKSGFKWVFADSVSYSGRYIYTKWDLLGILLSSWSLIPVQSNISTFWTSIEIKSYTWWEIVWYVSRNSILQWSGTILWWLAWLYTTTSASSKYPGCDTPDIKLANWQIWAACNVGATTAWNNQSTIINCSWSGVDCNSSIRYTLWSLFQWWRNDDVTSSDLTWTLAANWTAANWVWHNLFITGSISTTPDWIIAPQNFNLWGWSWATSTWWTYNSLWMPSAMQWPCAQNYHVPTIFEWFNAATTINPNIIWSWTWQTDTSIATSLKLPLSGYRDMWGTYVWQGNYWFYWASVSNGSYSNVSVKAKTFNPLNFSYRAHGLNLRCIKN